MTKKTRTIAFLFCLTIFIFFAPTAILYSQGYRINFNPEEGEKMITQTGGLFLKAQPRQTEVYLDGKLEKTTDFFFGSLLIENLLPQKYTVEVRKEGYHSWQKTLEIEEKTVTEAKSIILFPKDPKIKIIAENIQTFWLSPDGKKIILEEKIEKEWFLTLYEPEKDLKSQLLKRSDISTREVDLLDITFSEDSKGITLSTEMSETERYFALDITLAGSLPKETELAEASIKEYIIGDFRFKEENGNLYFTGKDSDSFEVLASRIKGFEFSPERRKIVYFTNNEIWITFLRNADLEKKTGDKVLLIRLSEQIKNVSWLNEDYIAFNTADVIKITETDNRNRLNIVDLKETKNPEIFWNKNDKKIYFLSGGILSCTPPLLP
jgi:hypothetical protein